MSIINGQSLRTQIILPKRLREAIERVRSQTGESLAEYLRRAAELRLEREQHRKTRLAKLAGEIIGGVKRGSWDKVDVSAWQRQMRRDRN